MRRKVHVRFLGEGTAVTPFPYPTEKDMLGHTAVDFLRPLSFRAEAECRVCLLPLGGIYWEDELPAYEALHKLPESDRNAILRLFSIRFKIWAKQRLSADDQEYWNVACSQVPTYALFHRLELSTDERQAQERVEREAQKCFEALIAGADDLTVTEGEDGLRSFSATFDLTKNETE
jgi:hypothetical protein